MTTKLLAPLRLTFETQNIAAGVLVAFRFSRADPGFRGPFLLLELVKFELEDVQLGIGVTQVGCEAADLGSTRQSLYSPDLERLREEQSTHVCSAMAALRSDSSS